MTTRAIRSHGSQRLFEVRDYDLDATLLSGQAFRWKQFDTRWHGVIGQHWVALKGVPKGIFAETAQPSPYWGWLSHYLQIEADLPRILKTFPDDPVLRQAVSRCQGLRLLRQDPWECLASFILSSTKQIVQIQQIVALLCERFGEEVSGPAGEQTHAFPTPDRLARCSEGELRGCRMGFRAPYLRETAQRIAGREIDLGSIAALPVEKARALLMELPGVGRKIADCVLLFAYGFSSVFPIDAAFPGFVAGRLPHLYFRGLLKLHSRYGPLDRSAAQSGLCHEASAQSVTQPSRSSATRSIDNSPGGTFLHWCYAPSGRTE